MKSTWFLSLYLLERVVQKTTAFCVREAYGNHPWYSPRIMTSNTLQATTDEIAMSSSIPMVHGIRDVVDHYDVFLLDMW